jgi:hypothetical protein
MFLLVYLLDAYEREPLSLVVGALAWGAVAATSLAGLANHDWGAVVARLGGPDLAAQWTAALTAPFVEETLKVVGVVLIYLIARSELNGLLDGFVYGAMVGLGFAVVENVFYFVGQFGGQPAGVLGGFFVRVLASGLYGHVLYTGLTGMGIAWFVTRTDLRPARRLAVAAGLCLAGVVGHFLWNSPLLNLFPTGNLTLADSASRRRQGGAVPGPGGAAGRAGPPAGAALVGGGRRRRAGRAGPDRRGAGGAGTAAPALAGQAGHAPPRRPPGCRSAPAPAAPAAQPGHAPHPPGRRRCFRPGRPAPTDRPDPPDTPGGGRRLLQRLGSGLTARSQVVTGPIELVAPAAPRVRPASARAR